MERDYSERLVRMQILKARGESRDSLLEQGNTRTSESKLTFNVTYYPVFENVRSILQELQVLLAPNKEHKKVFTDVPIVGFRLPSESSVAKDRQCWRFWTVWEGYLSSAWWGLCQSRPLNCTSEKVLYLLRCKICDDIPYVGKAKTKFHLWFDNYKSKHRSFRKGKQNVPQKRFHLHYVQDWHKGIDYGKLIYLRSVKRTNNLKKGKSFGNTNWKHFTHLV